MSSCGSAMQALSHDAMAMTPPMFITRDDRVMVSQDEAPADSQSTFHGLRL
jgi:hypothetical protein